MIRALDSLLITPPRSHLPAGEMIFRQGDPLDSIYILLDGQVKLYRIMDGQEVIFHSQTAGKILGLLALTRRTGSQFNCRTLTPTTFIKVSFEDLDNALQQSESLLVTFITVLTQSMARRSTRLMELQTEVVSLNRRLSNERDALAKALHELQQAQSLLVEAEKMATLGQLAAGVAHELNNPIAAINRAADFILEDLRKLADELPQGAVFLEQIERARTQKPVSTREQRERRRQLAATLDDSDLAEALVQMGVYSVAEFERMEKDLPGTRTERLARLKRYHQVGGALRNILHCSGRIGDLVKSLRSYSRTDHSEGDTTDINEGIEDTLRLFANRLRNVQVERQYGALPPVPLSAGPLNQVWTNIIANALDAMEDEGILRIETTTNEQDIVVHIVDSGPGIPPEHLSRIFDMRYTTRLGRIEFGLGLGLSISQNIIARYGGRIEVESKPGRTVFSICIPHQPSPTLNQPERNHAK